MKAREYLYPNEYFIHDLNPDDILDILQSSAWETVEQEITSAETNNDSCPEPNLKGIEAGENTAGVDAYVDIEFPDTVKTILDVGGGKFDVCRDYMKSRGIDLLVYDPYNRSQQHNAEIHHKVTIEKVAAATSMSVLNVIAEPEARLAHICTLHDALAINGIAYFKIWPGMGESKGTCVPMVNAYGYPGYQANAGAERFLREVQLAFGIHHAEVHEAIPNLIVAKKISDEPISKSEVENIQQLAASDAWYVERQQRQHDAIRFFRSHRAQVNPQSPKIENHFKQ